ncbi:MAG: RiPP maturation radical SAM C-methyltransferase [Pyrinomonadaceae bacterium]
MKKVLLLSMPYGALERPALGLSLLKSVLEDENIVCDVRYLTFQFAEFIGAENYQWMCYELPYTAFAGDWSFTTALYGEKYDAREQNYITEILQKNWQLDNEAIQRILYIKSQIPNFIEYCLNSIEWKDYSIVGFTSTFEQNIASLTLAKRIKNLYPEIKTVFGGANWEAEMGLELHRRFSFVDYACSGESEKTFPALVKSIFDGDSAEKIGGVVLRKDGESILTGEPDRIREMDDLPYPDYSDYFRDLEQSSSSINIFPTLLFETARGCWWGAKSHCTFCGLNGGSMSFRSKSPTRALDELDYLSTRWKTESVDVVDNILDMKYFDNLVPALAKAQRPMKLFYEVKSNLKRDHVKLLAEAGIHRIQPGIESLSNNILKLMRKGTTGLRNIQLLKWAKEFNVTAEWNLLYGFPGETADDYEEILQMLPAVKFLNPPCAVGPIRLDRFSPYFNAPEEFGLVNLRPMPTYYFLYPFKKESLMRIACYYEFDYKSGINPLTNARKVIEYINDWQANPETGSLYKFKNADGTMTLYDSRSNASIYELKLGGIEHTVYEFCDEVRSLNNIVKFLRETFTEENFSETQIEQFLDSMAENRLMIKQGTNYLSLAIDPNAVAEINAEFQNGISYKKQKPLSSYLPKELPIFNVNLQQNVLGQCS